MKLNSTFISLQEVPGEISFIFQISECPYRCPNCHSPELWGSSGVDLTEDIFFEKINPYKDYITTVVFFGGEWSDRLIKFLKISKKLNLKTCLYTGKDTVSDSIKHELNYLKLGAYIDDLGGLSSIRTNQVFWDLDRKIILNELFQKNSHIYTHQSRGEENAEINQGSN